MKASTASFIAYDLRPAKQAERRILLDFLKCGSAGGLSASDCRYVGMGGTKFYDHHLLHRFLGINKMISLERDPLMKERVAFNCPYDFIQVYDSTAAAFLDADVDSGPTIYWLDYDDGLSADITADIMSLGSRMTVGGFAFVTTTATPPGILAKRTAEERHDFFQTELTDFSADVTVEDLQNANFWKGIYKVLIAAFKNAFSARSDGVFRPAFQVLYSDSMLMITLGGFFCAETSAPHIERRVRADLPFLSKMQPYKIQNFALTERERTLFDIAVTKSRANSRQANKLKSLGFKQNDLDAYRDLIRFLPRYYESII